MRILHCTDFHANLHWFHWLARTAPQYDLVCLSGDLLDASSPETIPAQRAKIKKILGAIRTPMAICSGNHDMEHPEASGKTWVSDLRRKGHWTEGDRFDLGGHSFYCHPWGDPIPPARPPEIWIIHSPPEKCLAGQAKSGGDMGDHELGEVCWSGRGPRLVLCGHQHSPKAWYAEIGVTRVFNPGCTKAAPWPSHFKIDLRAGTAIRHGAPTVEPAISFLNLTPHEILRRFTDERLEEILQLAILNQQTEGHHLSPEEIEEVRQGIQRIARGKL